MVHSPASLRLCCLVAMAPALTSNVPPTVRAKSSVDNDPPHVPDSHSTGNPQEQTTINQQLTKQHLSVAGLQCNTPAKGVDSNFQSSNKLLNLKTIPNLAEILKKDGLIVRTGPSAVQASWQPRLASTNSGMNQASLSGIDQTGKCMSTTESSSGRASPVTMVPPLNNTAQHSKHSDNLAPLVSVGILNSRSSNSHVAASDAPGSMGLITQSSLVASTALKTCVTNGVNSLSKPLVNFVTPNSTVASSVRPLSSYSNVVPSSSTVSLVAHSQQEQTFNDFRHQERHFLSSGEMSSEASKKQRILELRAERVLRRLRRLQSRQSISHVKQQMCGFVENQQQNFLASRNAKNSSSEEFKAELLQSKDVKNLSTAALVNLVQKLQASQTGSHRNRVNSNSASDVDGDGKVHLEEEMCQDIDRVTGHLQSNLRHLQSALDSDATESSSGGESCDEADAYEEEWDGKNSKPVITRRAEWQWCQNRAAIASRWTWLQAQVSDLEYRIRQQNDIYRQIRASKGEVSLGEPLPIKEIFAPKDSLAPTHAHSIPKASNISLDSKDTSQVEMSPANVSTLLCNIDKQSSHLTQHLGNVYSPQTSTPDTKSGQGTPNGFVDHSHQGKQGHNLTGQHATASCSEGIRVIAQPSSFDPASPANDSSCRAARCRPVKTYRKRKLLKTAGLYQLSRKAAKLSTVKCHCFPPVVPCAMCGGRLNNVTKLDCLTMSPSERVALLDSAFHPVLSFPNDVPLSFHFESLLKTGDWQQKSSPKSNRFLPGDKRAKYNKDRVRNYARRLNKSSSAVFLSSAKIRSKYEQKQLARSQSSMSLPSSSFPSDSNTSEGMARAVCEAALQRKRKPIDPMNRRRSLPAAARRSRSASTSMVTTSMTTPHRRDSQSPLSGSSQAGSLREMRDQMKKKRTDSAYDINNIVIPYSIASSVRVEKLQYKEIVTPKWRKLFSEEESKPEAVDEDKVADAQTVKENGEAEKTDLSEASSTQQTDNNVTAGEEAKTCDDKQDEGEVEDLRDEVFVARHLSCEVAEKKRFSSIPNTSNRRGGRAKVHKSESNANLVSMASNCDSPDVLNSNSETVPHILSGPATPTIMPGAFAASLDEATEENSLKNKQEDASGRKRSVSVSSRSGIRSRSASHSEERGSRGKMTTSVTPWSVRKFPLSDTDMMELTCPQVRSPVTSRRCMFEMDTPSSSGTPLITPSHSNAASDIDELMGEDPDDPEWTVISEQKPVPSSTLPKTSIVLKLAKR